MEKKLPVIIFGSAGAAKDAYHWLKMQGLSQPSNPFDILGFVEQDRNKVGETAMDGKSIVTCDDDLLSFIMDYDEIGFVIPFGSPRIRKILVEKFAGYTNVVYPNVIHPSVNIDPDFGTMGKGNLIGPGTTFVSAYTMGDFNYISAGVLLGHDITMHDFNSINPSASIAGNVTIGNGSMVGLNATIIQELHISDDVIIGAGALVLRSIDEPGTYVGSPAKKLEKKQV